MFNTSNIFFVDMLLKLTILSFQHKVDGWQTMPTDDSRFAGVNTATLTISQVQQSDEGNYRCTVSNRLKKVASRVANLTISKYLL